jgi:hypothetical protein
MSITIEGFEKFMDEWVYSIDNRAEYINNYIKKYGYERLIRLKPKVGLSCPVNLGLYHRYP